MLPASKGESTIERLALEDFMMRYRLCGAFLAVFSLAVPALAHHSFAAEFDAAKCVNIQGTLTKVDWDNPHIYFYMDAKDASGKVTSWTFEGKSLPGLQRSGTHKVDFTESIGKILNVRACLAKNGGSRAAAETVTTPDGRVHSVGPDVENIGDRPAQDSYRARNKLN
jgi:hypothetical protein